MHNIMGAARLSGLAHVYINRDIYNYTMHDNAIDKYDSKSRGLVFQVNTEISLYICFTCNC
jgi:hypothetical protein